MINRIPAKDFIEQSQSTLVIDVRSGKEYDQGHIRRAINLPLFNDEERAIIGVLYKNSGREASVLKGLELTGPKLTDFVKKLHSLTDNKKVLVHCWRGGLRSESMAWLFSLAGYQVSLLEGGYKAYRRFIREEFSKQARIILLGGMTGTGKTELLRLLSKKGEQVIDIENIACHKGSVFGGLGQSDQPTNEQFENNIFDEWKIMDPSKIIWMEDESRTIGNISIPDPLFEQMGRAPMVKVETGLAERITRLVKDYSGFEKYALNEALQKISEKLGGTNTKAAMAALEAGDFTKVVELTLAHYDKAYAYSLFKREKSKIHAVLLEARDDDKNVSLILQTGKSIL